MALDWLDFNEDNAATYKSKIDESINMLRQMPISSTVASGTDGEDYEVDDWAPLTITDGLVYIFRAHIDNIGAFSIKHGATTYNVLLPDGGNPAERQILEGKPYYVLRDGADLVLLNAEPQVYPEFNYVINPEFAISQRSSAHFTSATTPANSDDTYLHDRWYLLSDGNDIVDVEVSTTPSSLFGAGGYMGSVVFDVETADKKFGYAQIIEGARMINLRGSICSLSFEAARLGASAITSLRAAVIEWTGTIDAVTSDVVSAWNAAGANPTLAASLAYAATPDVLPVLLSDQNRTIRIENIPISASATNLVIFIWSDHTTTTVGHKFSLTNVKLQRGPLATSYHNARRSLADEIALCERFFQKSYDLGITPGTVTDVGLIAAGADGTTANMRPLSRQLRTRMRSTPTIVWYSTDTATANRVRNDTAGANNTVNSTAGAGEGSTGYPVLSAGVTANDEMQAHYTASAEL